MNDEKKVKKLKKRKSSDTFVAEDSEVKCTEPLSSDDINDASSLETVREIVVERKSGFRLSEVLIIMIITLLFGALAGSFLTYTRDSNGNVFGVSSDLKEFVSTYNDIVDSYYDDLDKKELLDAAIKGMVDYLDDPYSKYMDITASDAFNEKVEGQYVGIGTEVSMSLDGVVTFSNPFEDGAAYKAGIRSGDVLVKVNGESVDNLTLTDISSKIKGKEGTTVHITVLRSNEEKEFSIVREYVDIISVTSQIYHENNKKIGRLTVNVFAANTGDQFENALKKLEKDKIDSLIIDVRDNSGGYLTTVSDILSFFLNKSKVMYQLETKGKKEVVHALTNTERKYPIAVLVNKGSASASEILAAAMKESYGAEVIGVATYGKGTVQRAYSLKSGATVKYTTQKWLTPKGNWIHEVGVEPTVVEELNEVYYETLQDADDNQLQKAISILSEK